MNNSAEQKFYKILEQFFSYQRPLSLLWKQDREDKLSFYTTIKGVKINAIFYIVGGRVNASLSVGKCYQKGFFRNEITFALNKKSHQADFNRLGFDKVASAVNIILIDKEEKVRQNEEIEHKMNALKRYFDFEKCGTARYVYRQFVEQKFLSVEFEGLYPNEFNMTQTLKFTSKNTDLLMKVCAYAAHLLEEDKQ